MVEEGLLYPSPYPSELCAISMLAPKGVAVVLGSLLHMHLNCGHWGSGS